MPPAFYHPLGPSEILPRYAYLGGLVAGARVLELGAVAASGGRTAAQLRELGARLVLAVDVSAEAIDRARRTYSSDPELRFRAASAEELADETFDVVAVADLAPYLRDPRGLDSLARLVAPGGRLVGGLRNPAGVALARLAAEEEGPPPPTFGQLSAALRERFASVEIASQSPLFGYALAPLAPQGEPELAVDGSLLDVEECAYFLAVCGQEPSGALSEHALVALPSAPLAVAAGQRAELAERLLRAEAEGAQARAELAPAQAAKAELELTLAQVRQELDEERALTAQERSRARRAEERADRLERAPSAGPPPEAETGRLRESLAALGRRVDNAEAERDALAQRLEAELARSRALDELAARRAAAEAELRAEVEALKAALAEANARAPQLGEALEEARARAGRLERDVETVSGLEHSARARAEKAEAELAVARAQIAELEDEAQVLERSLAEAEGRATDSEPAPHDGAPHGGGGEG